jgi:hypothetical protein
MRQLALLATMLFALALPACGPKPSVTTPSETPATPPAEVASAVYADSVSVEVNDHQMTVAWVKRGTGAISGYNIYLSSKPLALKADNPASVQPHNESPFPGDTEPEDGIEHYVAEGLENGIKYYVTVRVAYPDGSVSKPSNEILAVCGPRGEIELSLRYQGERDGWSFEGNQYVRADNASNDLYFFSREGADYLGSPNRLDGFLNVNKFAVLPYYGTLRTVAQELMHSKITATEDQVQVAEGDWVLLTKTNGRNALLNVVGMSGADKSRAITLSFAYCTLVGEVAF